MILGAHFILFNKQNEFDMPWSIFMKQCLLCGAKISNEILTKNNLTQTGNKINYLIQLSKTKEITLLVIPTTKPLYELIGMLI